MKSMKRLELDYRSLPEMERSHDQAENKLRLLESIQDGLHRIEKKAAREWGSVPLEELARQQVLLPEVQEKITRLRGRLGIKA